MDELLIELALNDSEDIVVPLVILICNMAYIIWMALDDRGWLRKHIKREPPPDPLEGIELPEGMSRTMAMMHYRSGTLGEEFRKHKEKNNEE